MCIAQSCTAAQHALSYLLHVCHVKWRPAQHALCVHDMMCAQDPELYAQLNKSMADVARLRPLNDAIEDVSMVFYQFDTPQVYLFIHA